MRWRDVPEIATWIPLKMPSCSKYFWASLMEANSKAIVTLSCSWLLSATGNMSLYCWLYRLFVLVRGNVGKNGVRVVVCVSVYDGVIESREELSVVAVVAGSPLLGF
jgi:hypothetical protein